MSQNNNYQAIQDNVSSIPLSTKEFLRTQQKDIVCSDCGGISATKVQQLLSTLEGTTQLFKTTPQLKNLIPNTIKSRNIRQKKPNRSISVNKKKTSARNNSQKTSLRRNMKKKTSQPRKKNSTKQRKSSSNKTRSSLSSRNNNNNNKIRSKSTPKKNKKLTSKKK